jgi:hypothetical protein
MSNDAERVVKIGFRDANGDVETLWAFSLGDGRYRIDNTPWYQYGVSWHDIVEAHVDADGMPWFDRVTQKSGNRTLRVKSEKAVPTLLLEAIKAIGCTYEGANPKFIAIDVPAAILLDEVVDLLVQSNLQWEYADPTYEQLHGAG